jgi:hypothetical protein
MIPGMANPPDRGNDEKRKPQPLNFVRGGAVCQSGEKGGHLLKGTNQAAVCMPTVGSDTRSRWRAAGKPVTPKSRHSIQYLQHRKVGR